MIRSASLTKVVKWGNSLGLRIPKNLAEDVHVKEGTLVELTVVDGNMVVKTNIRPYFSLKKLLGEVTEDNLHTEVKFGDAVGLEQW